MQIISNDKTVRSETMLDKKDFNNRCLTTHAKKDEQLVSTRPDNK